MGMKPWVLMACLGMAGAAPAKNTLPRDIQVFVRNADLCEHMAGEWDSDLSKKRKNEIERAVVKYAGPAQKQLKLLAEKYKNDPRLQSVISGHAHDSVKSYRE
jgi:hypothetical protein